MVQTQLDRETVLVRSPGLEVAELEGEMVVLDTAAGQYYGLNEVGARILAHLETPRRVSELIALLAEEYAADASQLEADVLEFLEHLAGQRLESRAANVFWHHGSFRL